LRIRRRGCGFVFETIHTIAWCILINGVVQGILSRNGAWKDIRYQVTAYTVLAVVVVAVTQPVWQLVQMYGGPNGYPFDLTTGESVYLPNVLIPTTTFLDVLKGAFLNPLAAPLEPLFPYLSISFVGSIIAIVISQPPGNVPRHFPKTMVLIGSLMFIVGTVGIVWFFITIATGPGGFAEAADALMLIPFHRHWYNYPKIPATFTFPFAWLWQFLSLNGLAIMLTMLLIRAVEFRGRGASFAEKTAFIRRFGFIAFTNYNNQWCIWILQYVFGVIIAATGAQLLTYPGYMPGDSFNPYQRLDWGFTLLLVAAVFAVYHAIMRLWEKVGYIGSLEWCILTIIYAIVPAKKTGRHGETRKSWWQKGKLDVCNAFYNPEWLDIVRKEEVDHANNVDSKLALKVALAGLASIIFMPVTFITLAVAIEARKTEGRNRYNSIAKTISVIGICVIVSVLISLFFITPRMIRLPL